MIQAHFDAIERTLIAMSQIPANSGHTNHRGTPREAFIREFLSDHLSERFAIGTGEIIDSDSAPRERRNQFDIVVYRRDFPKLRLGGGINAFLAESVLATIEVKSILDRDGVRQAVRAARNAKLLKQNFVSAMWSGYQPPSILNYLVAYEGPSKMETVRDWIHECQREDGLLEPKLSDSRHERIHVPSPSIDAVFILGKGFWYFDNVPSSLVPDDVIRSNANLRWVHGDSPTNNLLLLFFFLTLAGSGVTMGSLDPVPYLADVNFGAIAWGAFAPSAI